MIPPEKTDSVTRALREAFGVSAFDDIRPLTNIQSKILVFRIVVQGSAYLLRIILRTDDPTRHFACMTAAAAAGIAPRVRYTSVDDKLSITDFIDAVPFPAADALRRMPAVLRTVHALPPFGGTPDHLNTTCTYLLNPGPALDTFFARFRAANLLPPAELDELFALHAQLAAAFHRQESDQVSSHCDLFKPDNILYDGTRVWLVDWEAAFLNDRYADLAVVANMLVTSDAEERTYLEDYFGHAPDACQLARLHLMRQLAHLFYTLGFLFLGSMDKPLDPAPVYDDVRRSFWTGELQLTDGPKKILFARYHWDQLRHNARQPRFGEALRTRATLISDRRD